MLKWIPRWISPINVQRSSQYIVHDVSLVYSGLPDGMAVQLLHISEARWGLKYLNLPIILIHIHPLDPPFSTYVSILQFSKLHQFLPCLSMIGSWFSMVWDRFFMMSPRSSRFRWGCCSPLCAGYRAQSQASRSQKTSANPSGMNAWQIVAPR